jgi:hypothetical protein
MYDFLLYVHKYSIFTNDYELYVYGVNTNDIFHTIGEFYYRSETKISRLVYVECTQQKLDYWAKQGFKIYRFFDKY